MTFYLLLFIFIKAKYQSMLSFISGDIYAVRWRSLQNVQIFTLSENLYLSVYFCIKSVLLNFPAKLEKKIIFFTHSKWLLFLFTCYFNSEIDHTSPPQLGKGPSPPQPPAATRRTWGYDNYYTLTQTYHKLGPSFYDNFG